MQNLQIDLPKTAVDFEIGTRNAFGTFAIEKSSNSSKQMTLAEEEELETGTEARLNSLHRRRIWQ